MAAAKGNRNAKMVAAAGLVVAVIGVVVALAAWLFPLSDSPQPAGDTIHGDVTPSVGDDGCVAVQGICLLNQNPTEDEVVKAKATLEALPGAGLPPTGSGLSMFLVAGTQGDGLYVRDGFTQTDARLSGHPTLKEGTHVYVDCRVDDEWVADPTATGGVAGRWYKIRYPEVAKVGDFWVYGGYLLPVGHNGAVPLCNDAQRR